MLELNKERSQWECYSRVMTLAIVPREGHDDDPGHLSALNFVAKSAILLMYYSL